MLGWDQGGTLADRFRRHAGDASHLYGYAMRGMADDWEAGGPVRTVFAGYVITYEGQRLLRQPQRDVRIAELSVTRGARPAGSLTPSMNFYPADPNEPIGTPSIHYGVLKDLYSSVIGFDRDSATFRLFLNPGVMGLWAGGFVVAAGGLVAAWPGRRRLAPLPEPEVARTPVAAAS